MTLFVFIFFNSFSQSKPYSDGVYNFGVYDKEYGITTARCKVTVNKDFVTVKVTQCISKGIYSVNQVIYSGKIIKYKGLYYIVENGRGPGLIEDFEYETARIDFSRKFVIHN